MALKMHPSLAVHVGDWLKCEIVEPAGVSVTALSEHFGVSRQALSTLLNGNANLSADMAIRFEKAFGIKAVPLAPASERISSQDTWFAMKKTSRFSGVPCTFTFAPQMRAVRPRNHMGKGDPYAKMR